MQILNTVGLSALICGMGILTFLSTLCEVTGQTACILTTQNCALLQVKILFH